MTEEQGASLVPAMFLVGAFALVGQTVLIRELMVSFYGTELALAAVLSCWFLFVPAGALLGTAAVRLTSRWHRLTTLGLVGLGLGLPAGFVLARLLRPILGAETGEFLGPGATVVAGALATWPVALWTGFLFPVIAGHEERRAGGQALGISRIYVAEAVGSAAAGAVLSLYLLDHAGAHTIVFASGLMMLSVAAWHSAGADGRSLWAAAAGVATIVGTGIVVGRSLLGVAGGVVLAAGLCARLLLARRRARDSIASLTALGFAVGTAVIYFGWGGQIARATENARWRTFSRFHLRASRDSRYQHIQIGYREGQYVLVQDGRRTAQFPERAASRARAVLLLTQHPQPRDVLVIGGGLGGLCQEMLAAGVRRLDYVEADPKLLALVAGHLPDPLGEVLRDPRFTAYPMDGRRFVHRLAGRPGERRYDLAVVNIGDPASAADSRFYTVEFFRKLRVVLRPGGVAAFCGITGDENYMAGDPVQLYTTCIFRTLRRVWDRVVVRPGDEFCYFVGRHATADPRLLEKRFEELGFGPEGLKHSFRLEHFPPERTEWVRNEMDAAASRAPFNTDERPVLFTLFLAVQAHYVADRGRSTPGTRLFGIVRRLPPYLLWLPLAGVPLVVLAVRLARRAPSRVAGALGVLGTGAFGLSAELLIIYRYQTSFGFVYRDISIIAGVFMLGLAAGGWMAGRAASSRTRSRLLATEAGQAIFILVLPATLGLISVSPVLFIAAALMAGWLTGSEFPLAARSGLMAGQDSAGVAGLLDAADHLGALLGAAGAGLLLLPALGTVQTAALVALLKCSTLCGLVVAFRRDGRA